MFQSAFLKKDKKQSFQKTLIVSKQTQQRKKKLFQR